jgi:hypothetical protein
VEESYLFGRKKCFPAEGNKRKLRFLIAFCVVSILDFLLVVTLNLQFTIWLPKLYDNGNYTLHLHTA